MMKMMKKSSWIIILFGLIVPICSAFLVDDCREDVIKEFENAWSQIQEWKGDGKTPKELLVELSGYVKKVPEIISKVERELNVYEYEEALKSLSRINDTSETWKSRWSEIAILTSPVDVLYGHFKLFPDMPETFTPGAEIMDFDVNVISDLILKPLYNRGEKGTITLAHLVDHIHTMVVSQRTPTTFTLLDEFIDDALEKSNYCLWNGKTPQRVIYGFYVSLLVLDIKEFTLNNFGLMIRHVFNGTNSDVDVERAVSTLTSRAKEKYAAARDVLSQASPAFWRCDPSKFIEDENFVAFKELLQGYIENESKMHPSGSCKQSCGDFQYVKTKCNQPSDDACLQRRMCTGTLIDCDYIAADAEVCLSDAPRRFDYIRYKKGPHLGNDSRCTGVTERRDSHWRLFYHCSNCFCLCDDPNSPTTVRHISLVPVLSDVKSNRIITGVRFEMKEGILQLQIEQGIPERNGFILEGSTEWKALGHLEKTNPKEVLMLDYIDRAMDLDDIVVPPDHVVTGIKFRKLGSHVNMEVQATQINPQTGELLHSSSHWISNDNTPEAAHHPREELGLEDPRVPTDTTKPSIPDSVHDQFVKFGASSRAADVSQTTVPYIDIQPVRPNPPVWLQGVGLYHRGQPGFGGFVAPRVFTRSVSDFIA